MSILTHFFLKDNFRTNNHLVLIATGFAFFINLSEKISTILLIIFFTISVLNTKNFLKSQLYKVSIVLILFFIYLLINLLVEDNFSFKTIEQKLSLLVLPLAFSSFYINKKALEQICLFFVYGAILACILNLIEPFVNDFNWTNFQFVQVREKIFFKNNNWLNHFFSVHFPNFIERSYYSIYLNFAIAIILFLLDWSLIKKIIAISFLTFHILLSNSLFGLFGLGVLFVIFIFSFRNKMLILLVPVFVLFILLISTRLREYLSEFLLYLSNTENIPKNFIGNRWEMWIASLELIRESSVFGYGKEGFDIVFNDRLHENVGWSRYQLSQVGYNSHNQFMQFLGEIGLLGLVAYVLMFLNFILRSIRKKDNFKCLKLSFIFLIFFFSLSESLINRYIGISFFTFFYCLLLVSCTKGPEFNNYTRC